MVQMHYEKPAPSISLEKRGDGATEAPIWGHSVSLSFAPAAPTPTHIFFGVHKENLLHFRGVGGQPRIAGWDLPWLVLLCRNNTFLQRRSMELEQMQPGGQYSGTSCVGAELPNPAPAREKKHQLIGILLKTTPYKHPGRFFFSSSFLSALQQDFQPNFPAWLARAGQPHPGAARQPPAATRYFGGRGELGCSAADGLSRSAPGGSAREPLAHSQVSAPPRQRRRRMRMVDSTQANKPERRVPEPGQGRCEAAGLARLLRGCFRSCKNSLRVQVGCLQPPCSSGGAVPGNGGPRFLV